MLRQWQPTDTVHLNLIDSMKNDGPMNEKGDAGKESYEMKMISR